MTQHPAPRRRLRTACAVAVACAGAAIGATAAAAADRACPASGDAFTLQLQALTGPAGADLTATITVAAGSSCAVPDVYKKLQVKTFAADGTVAATRNVTDVPAPHGVATVDLGNVPRGRRVEADVLVQTDAAPATFVVRAATRTLLRPDLVVRELVRPRSVLVGAGFDVGAVIAERNGDVGATAQVTLSALPGSVEPVTVPAGGTATVTFHGLAFDAAGPVELSVGVRNATPYETDGTNDALAETIDVTKNVLGSRVLFPSLVGYGAQFNGHLYAPITEPKVPPGEYQDVEDKINDLQPQLVRIFYNDNWEENQDNTHPEWQQNYDSFVRVVGLAQATGATIDIGYQNLGNLVTRKPPFLATDMMHRFANALEDLVVGHGYTNVHWAEVANEPNSGAVRLDQYKELTQALHDELVARGLHDQIKIMGGGLVENAGNPVRDHYAWMTWIAQNMGGLVDAYAEHVYWLYPDTGRLEYRLRDTYHLMQTELTADQQKPLYMMEFGIRGDNTCGSKPKFNYLYYGRDPNCTEIWRTNIAGFQQLWFTVDAAQLGIAGASKWDAYWAVYDRNSEKQQLYWMTGPASEDYPLTPTYHAMSLLFHSTVPGWRIVRVDPWADDDEGVPAWRIEGHSSSDQPEQELVAYAGPSGELTIVGLDTHGKDLNGVSPDPPSSYSIGGLPPNATFTLAVWNATGDGTNTIAGPVTANANGVARFEVPLQAAFALTNVPVA
jgi:hypothetical protein